MKVGIFQDTITLGGRLAVIIEIIKSLNEFGIVPDLISRNIKFNKEDIVTFYNAHINYNIKKTNTTYLPKLVETSHILYPLQIRKILKQYDLVINSNNTLLFLPDKIISYIHFPRKARLFNNIHRWPNEKEHIKPWTRVALLLDHAITYMIHLLISPKSHTIIANSYFTKHSLVNTFKNKISEKNITVIYPPVHTDNIINSQTGSKQNKIVSIGRFSESKKQKEQILTLTNLPDYEFVIIGMTAPDNPYYRECESIIEKNNIKNITLKPNLPLNELTKELESSLFYLHTTWNEPFGISIVQSIIYGCIPVIPASGGQTEIVPFKELQYTSFDQIPDIIRSASRNAGFYQNSLKDHIKRFSTENFSKNFKNILSTCLKKNG